jgi:hypothetical protein
MLAIARRTPELLPVGDRAAYVRLARRAFDRSQWPVRRSLRDALPPRTWKRLSRERGVPADATPRDLDVFDWVAVFRACRKINPGSARRR